MSLQTKKTRLFQALKEAGVDRVFNTVNDNHESLVLQASQTMKNSRCIISIDLDERIFNSIYYFLGNLDNAGKKQKMLDLMNELNEESLMVKYYLDEDDAIMARVTYMTLNEAFDGRTFLEIMMAAFKSIEDNHYNRIMRLIWA